MTKVDFMTLYEEWTNGLITMAEGVLNYEVLEVVTRWFANCVEMNQDLNCFDMEELTRKFISMVGKCCINYAFINELMTHKTK